jgi:hypothetical protein
MALVEIGGKVDAGSVKAIGEMILKILHTKADQSTIQKALDVFQSTCPKSTGDHAVISNCNFSQKGR